MRFNDSDVLAKQDGGSYAGNRICSQPGEVIDSHGSWGRVVRAGRVTSYRCS
jgi:hypothetical protein